jgi:hypothetical protein
VNACLHYLDAVSRNGKRRRDLKADALGGVRLSEFRSATTGS